MSLAINAEKVFAVLLGDDWYDVVAGSFYLDSYEFVEDDSDDAYVLHPGGRSGVCATGFSFKSRADKSFTTTGPLTAIQAVRYA